MSMVKVQLKYIYFKLQIATILDVKFYDNRTINHFAFVNLLV